MSLRASIVAALVLASVASAPAGGVLIDSRDGDANTGPPPDDPGWAYVGRQGQLTAVYLGDGWVLTANHVQVEGVTSSFLGVEHQPRVETRKRILNPDGTPTDLQVFRIATHPDLAPLPIRAAPPAVGDAVVMIGYGGDRGAERRDLFAPADVRDGWEWLPGTHSMRWGTNLVSATGLDVTVQGAAVRHFTTHFDRGLPTPYEAQATPGDSGGAVFIKRDGGWELAGIMFASDSPRPPFEHVAVLSMPPRQPIRTYSVDLAHYRQRILEIVRPAAVAGR